MTADSSITRTDLARATAISLFLLAVYLGTASGRFHSDDEMSVWAVAMSLVGRGEATIPQLAWNQDLGGGVGRALDDGRVYAKYGLGTSLLLLPFIWLASFLPDAGFVRVSMLLNAPVTALSAGLLYLIGRRLGYRPPVAMIVGLAFGIATSAWVYARYLFGEPIVGLGWLLALALLIGRPGHGRSAAAGVAVGLTVLVRSAGVVAAPVFLPMLWRNGQSVRHTLLFSLPVLLSLAVTGWYNLARFGSPFDSGYDPIEGFTGSLEEALYGFLVTPGRGLFVYAPPALLAILGAPTFWRRHRPTAIPLLLVVFTTLSLYAKWHAWHGGWGWGPRLILPVVPLLLLVALPVIQDALGGGRTAKPEDSVAIRPEPIAALLLRLLVGSVLVGGFIVSCLGVLVDFNIGLRALLAEFPRLGAGVLYLTILDWSTSPIVAHLRLLGSAPSDLFWANGPGWRLSGAVVVGTVLSSALALLYQLHSGSRAALFPLAGAPVLLVGLFLAAGSSQAGRSETDLDAALATLTGRIQSTDSLVVVASRPIEALLNQTPPGNHVLQVLPEGDPVSPRSDRRLRATLRGRTLWLFQEATNAVSDDNGIERRIDELAYKTSTYHFGDYRLTRYAIADPDGERPTGVEFDGRLRLVQWAARRFDDVLAIDLWWEALGRGPAHIVASVRLVDPAGRLAAQLDREPTDGALPFEAWPLSGQVRDRFGITLPAGLADGNYQLQLVVYPPGGRPLPTGSGEVATIGTVRLP